jgi:hypothetical protein
MGFDRWRRRRSVTGPGWVLLLVVILVMGVIDRVLHASLPVVLLIAVMVGLGLRLVATEPR